MIVGLVQVSGYEHLAGPGRSDRAVRRYLAEWAQAGHARQLVRLALDAYDRMLGLNLGGRPLRGDHQAAVRR